MKFTEKQLNDLKQQGKIKGWTDTKKKPAPAKKKKRNPIIPNRSKEKQFVFNRLCEFALINGFMKVEEEYKFHPVRKWRFDWAILEIKLAVEYEGIFSRKSRHTTISGFTGDIEKYNEATVLGWRVIRVTAKDYQNINNTLKRIKEV